MISRRVVFLSSIIATAVSCFTLGVMQTRRGDSLARAAYHAPPDASRAEVRTGLGSKARTASVVPAATAGRLQPSRKPADDPTMLTSRAKMVAEIKQELQAEMGLLPVHLLRDRRSSFVELYSHDNFGKTNYGTAGY